MKNNSLSFWRFLFVHKMPFYQAACCGLLSAGITGFVLDNLLGQRTGKELAFTYLAFIVIGSIVVFPLLTQYRYMKSVLKDGIEVSGKVIDLYFAWGQGYVAYEYAYHGQKYRASDEINRTRGTKKLQIGQSVTLCLDCKDLKQAYIQEIYL